MDEMETPPTTEAILEAALLAQLQQAEDLKPGGALEVLEALPVELQRVVLDVIEKREGPM